MLVGSLGLTTCKAPDQPHLGDEADASSDLTESTKAASHRSSAHQVGWSHRGECHRRNVGLPAIPRL